MADVSTRPEEVVLLDDGGRAIGTAAKATVHRAVTPLHLAFSCYLFRGDDLLLTRRADDKVTFPGVWTNSVCGHPMPGEGLAAGIRRRARDELGLEVVGLRLVLPGFRYRAEMAGVQEHEWCPVAVGELEAGARPVLRASEVAGAGFVPWRDLVQRVGDDATLSPWCREQVPALDRLGASWRQWPSADPALLPPAAHWGAKDE